MHIHPPARFFPYRSAVILAGTKSARLERRYGGNAMNIAFIGLGNMGRPMAANLAKAGYHLRCYDLFDGARAAAEAAGLPVSASAVDAAKGANVLVTMLPDGASARQVWEGVIDVLAPGAVAIDCSTIDLESARALHRMASAKGLQPVDAPVSGGVGGATNATLTFMCGGEDEALDGASRILASMGQKIVRCGPAGAGQAAKICNNMVLGISMIGVCEAFALADRMGLSAKAMFDVVSTSSGQCWSINTYCPVPGVGPQSPADNDYKPGFAAALMAKDLRLAKEAATATGAQTPLGTHASEIYEAFVKNGNGGQDFSAIIQALTSRPD
jgi:3-hydroxyisobutyrate dehydrogenase